MTRRVLLVGATGVFGRGWSFAGAPLPLRLASRVHARACAAGARYQYCVAVAHLWLGLLFASRGRLDA